MTPPQDAPHAPLSQLLDDLAAGEGPLTLDAAMDQLGRRAFGAVLFLFSAPNLLPLPPGSSTVFSVPLLILAPQMAVGRDHPWLPNALLRRELDRERLRPVLRRLAGLLRRVERVSRPRLRGMFGPVGDRAIGAVCALMAFILIFPIPFGNLLPGAATALLALSLVMRDGWLAVAGHLTAVASLVVLGLTGHVAWAFFQRAWQLFGG